ncbi:alpha/beta hydrolase, partial [Klebsiella oxytoca]
MLSNGAKDYKAKLFENHDENIHFLLNTPLSLQRQVWESAAIKATLPAGVCIETVNDTEITAEWISYPDSINTRIILYFHGGGNSQGSCLTHRKLAACLAQYSG